MSFQICDRFREHHEGGVGNNPDDAGGFTAYGLASSFWARKYPGFFADPTPKGARQIFEIEFYREHHVGRLAPHYQVVFYDLLVNHSPRAAKKIFQRGLGGGLKIDGMIGPRTLHRAEVAPDRIARICAKRAKYYHELVARDANQQVFLDGWLWRAQCLALYATGVRYDIPINPDGSMDAAGRPGE